MKTRSECNNHLPGRYVGAISAMLVGLAGLRLAQESPVKHATANSTLSTFIETAVRGGKEKKAAVTDTSSKGAFKSMALVSNLIPNLLELRMLLEAISSWQGRCARAWLKETRLEISVSITNGVKLDEKLKIQANEELKAYDMTIEGVVKVLNISESENPTTEISEVPSQPMPEFEIVGTTNDPSDPKYPDMLKNLFINLIETSKLCRELKDNDIGLVNRPITMITYHRPNMCFRLVYTSLPYTINDLALQWRYNQKGYILDPHISIPVMQAKRPAPLPFIYVCSVDNYLFTIEVMLGQKDAVVKLHKEDAALPAVSSPADLAGLMKKQKAMGKIPETHKLAIGYFLLKNPKTPGNQEAFVCSDGTLIDDLKTQEEFLTSKAEFDGSYRKVGSTHAIYVDPKYAHIMNKHSLDAFKMLHDYPFLNEKLKFESEELLNWIRVEVAAIPPQGSTCTVS